MHECGMISIIMCTNYNILCKSLKTEVIIKNIYIIGQLMN